MSFPVHEAARDNKRGIVQGLLAENSQIAVTKDDDGRTPLHWAVAMRNKDVVEAILPFLKETDLDELTDASGWTVVHIAAAVGDGEILDLVMAHVPQPDVNLQTSNGTTALHLAVSKNHEAVVDRLLRKYAAKATTKDKRGITPLHRAAAIGNENLVRRLISAKVHLNASDADGYTALHHAMAEGNAEIAVLLVQSGADRTRLTRDGELPEQVALPGVGDFFRKALSL